MKRVLAVVLLSLFLGAGSLRSQDVPPPNPGLVINIVTGYSIEFVFDEFNEYVNGIMGGADHQTFIRIGSIYDWKLRFKADQLMFYGINPSNQMELNNVGVLVESNGTNDDDGTNIINYAKFSPLALESNDVTLLTKGSLSNRGYGIENTFTLKWEMGTRNGNMNPTTMLDQVLANDTYTLNIILTLSVY